MIWYEHFLVIAFIKVKSLQPGQRKRSRLERVKEGKFMDVIYYK